MCISKKCFYILGDFNDDLLSQGNKLGNVIKSNKLVQLIEVPTRVTPTSSTLLDLVVTNNPGLVLSKTVVPVAAADHGLVSITLNIAKHKRHKTIRTFRQLALCDNNTFCNSIVSEQHNFNELLMTDDVNYQLKIFNDNFIKCLDRCAPVVTKEIKRPFSPWFTDEIRDAINRRDDVRIKLKGERANSTLWEQYRYEKSVVETFNTFNQVELLF